MKLIDVNCDIGEGFEHDADLLTMVSSANIACGYHAGDHNTMAATVAAAAVNAAAIGAHPGLPDRENFGRREMAIEPEDVHNLVLAQIGALWAIARAQGRALSHVKPHGALYHMAERDTAVAAAIVQAVVDFDPRIAVMGLSGGQLARCAEDRGARAIHEVFADRAYAPGGMLVARSDPRALIRDGAKAADRIASLIAGDGIAAVDGSRLDLRADTVCIHSDRPGAARFALEFTRRLAWHGMAVARGMGMVDGAPDASRHG